MVWPVVALPGHAPRGCTLRPVTMPNDLVVLRPEGYPAVISTSTPGGRGTRRSPTRIRTTPGAARPTTSAPRRQRGHVAQPAGRRSPGRPWWRSHHAPGRDGLSLHLWHAGSGPVRIEHAGQVWVASATSWKTMAPARRLSPCAATPSSPNPPSACPSTAGLRSPCCLPTSTPGGPRMQAAGKASVRYAAYAFGQSTAPAAGGVDSSIGPIVAHGRWSRSTPCTAQPGALPPTHRA